MLKGWQGGTGAVIVTLGTVALVLLDLADHGFRLWWLSHAFTTDTVAGVLVVLLTVLVVDQVVRRRQILDRARAISAQAVILVAQASRAAQAVSAVLTGSGDRDAAGDAFRTYMIMLMVAAPVLIDAKISRDFLEEAQRMGGELAHALARLGRDGAAPSTARIDAAAQRLKDASAPLMSQLTAEERTAFDADISP
ncbi:MAG TPA: hypothetical protein VHU92_01160 [Streptosporangiaceae bacterium]|jgi:hypothetical protein|nr:hypothetical protein [Streptosporangiaceae bacterium]